METQLMLKFFRTSRELKRHEQWSRDKLMIFQGLIFQSIRNHVYAHSRFYQRFHRGMADYPLQALPVITKSMLMENYDEIVTHADIRLADAREHINIHAHESLYLDRYRIAATSGTTGQPGLFLFDENEWVIVIASFARGQAWAGAPVDLRHRKRLATVASNSPWHMSSQVSSTARTWWTPSLRIAATEPLEKIVGQLNEWQPHILISYASMARILAAEQLDGRLHISPEQIFVSSEVLTEQTRQIATQAWAQAPFDQYGATEFADIAAEHVSCRRMHLFEDLLIVESVDEQNQAVPDGTYGAKLLVTSLFSRTLPLIRYELSDSVCITAEDHSCGLPFRILKGIQGRTKDAFMMPARSGGRKRIDPVLFLEIMDFLPVRAWQVIQNADDSLTVLLGGAYAEIDILALRNRLAHDLADHDIINIAIDVQKVTDIPKSANGKIQQIKAYSEPDVQHTRVSNAQYLA